MALYSVSQIILTPKEIDAFSRILALGNQAFAEAHYPIYYDHFLATLYHLNTLCRSAIREAVPNMKLSSYLKEEAKIKDCLNRIRQVEYQPMIEKKNPPKIQKHTRKQQKR